MKIFKNGRDRNDNKIVKISFFDRKGKKPTSKGFSIQTLGNLPETHQNGINENTEWEVFCYLDNYGTPKQKKAFGIREKIEVLEIALKTI